MVKYNTHQALLYKQYTNVNKYRQLKSVSQIKFPLKFNLTPFNTEQNKNCYCQCCTSFYMHCTVQSIWKHWWNINVQYTKYIHWNQARNISSILPMVNTRVFQGHNYMFQLLMLSLLVHQWTVIMIDGENRTVITMIQRTSNVYRDIQLLHTRRVLYCLNQHPALITLFAGIHYENQVNIVSAAIFSTSCPEQYMLKMPVLWFL